MADRQPTSTSKSTLPIPIGYDAYRQWERWPQLRSGARAYMRSTYDRTGGNEWADASHFLYQEADDFNVTLDLAGPGVLYFARYNHWHGSPWHYEVDGQDHIVQETFTADRRPRATQHPLAAPTSYADFEFEAEAGRTYYLWVRGKSMAGFGRTDSFWAQFDDEIGTERLGPGHEHVEGLGQWAARFTEKVYAWSSGSPQAAPQTVTFDRPGKHRLRIQPRYVTHYVEQVWLSAARTELPDLDGPVTKAGHARDIVLGAADALAMAGAVRVVDDPASALGRVLEMGEEPATFLPEHAFPKPLAWNWDVTKGADLSWVVIPFERSFRMAYSRTRYGTGYYIYHQYAPGMALSQPITSWKPEAPPADVAALLNRAGEDIAPRPGTAEGDAAGVKERSGRVTLTAGGMVEVAELTDAPTMLRALEFSAPREQAVALGKARLRVWWDGRAPSVDAPLALFFGAGTLYNRDDKEYLVKSLPMVIRFDAERVHLACYFPMPFFRSARITLEAAPECDVPEVEWSVRWTSCNDSPEHVGYLHATYRDHLSPVPGEDLVLLDTRLVEGGGDWSGHLVGNSWIFSHRAVLNTLEGDPRFFFDDSLTPQAQGTGTEEWGGGGDYWARGCTMTLPLAGHPVGAPHERMARHPEDKIESAYRFLLADLMPFGSNALVRLEHGGRNEAPEHYETLTYWYGRPGASLVLTDELDVGDAESEWAHEYVSPEASAPAGITSRYEWGVDALPDGAEVYPAHTETERHTAGTSEFTLRLRRDNAGVMLRRTLDYSFANQRAEVYLSDPVETHWEKAGVWYLAGSNTCVASNPPEELGATQHIIQTSNRRFRDDEFLLPLELTRGREAVRVRVVFAPVERPLFPGQPLPELAWSEIRYRAYCLVAPR